MYKPIGSWVAIPTPFNESGTIDWKGFEILIDHQAAHGTSTLLVMGSAGEVTLLSEDERKEIVRRVSKYAKGKIPVFFGATFPTTEETIKFSQYAESEGADGLVYTAPPYLLPPQTALAEHLLACTKSVSIPVAIYNNPSRVGVFIKPDTIGRLADECPNFVADKEAMGSVQHLVEVKRRVGDRVHILCCDFPQYSILLPTLAIGGHGAANIGGNIIPEEMAIIARPWDSIDKVEESRRLYFKYYPLLEALYWFSNPIVIKAALNILGLPAGKLRRPYPELRGEKLDELKRLMDEMGIIEKYGQR
ncbi:Dihydrodipicolinate synthase [Tepidanaerobacter acetatoxydans Re1]|uniref:4-hydroxy-tetrahydrodipicolinate synthase n=1 Tax=Tepidanaerobacter acetatoxydans (strain DSM 21804 / JCM 16047 / Re1) TaxID=1209989 RepID=F4LUJ9_TEPAE|nr:4-hydroxy-tetrahydrodipicolinate synthase [Tepidanaerobacter acetatoxydans]AEE92644.1 Dihydrodipicolinate synthase [Tepidanaerobacter acetatoxydans Re1]CCP27617.1 Dihydrodipicolinate synthase [Tepidanaerobacter acetatoxydans Re1]